MLTLADMRAMARFIEEELPHVLQAEFRLVHGLLELEVKTTDGRAFQLGVFDLDLIPSWLGEQFAREFCEAVHRFVRDQKAQASVAA